MYVPFTELPDHSRIWIYQADREFTAAEETEVESALRDFCKQWVAHGNPLKTSFLIDRRQFLLLAVDEGLEGASGCSIDGSVRILKTLQASLGIDFLGRSRVPFLMDGKVKLIPVKELKESFTSGILEPGTLTFNLLAPTKGAWRSGWILAAGKTWMAQYLPKTTVT